MFAVLVLLYAVDAFTTNIADACDKGLAISISKTAPAIMSPRDIGIVRSKATIGVAVSGFDCTNLATSIGVATSGGLDANRLALDAVSCTNLPLDNGFGTNSGLVGGSYGVVLSVSTMFRGVRIAFVKAGWGSFGSLRLGEKYLRGGSSALFLVKNGRVSVLCFRMVLLWCGIILVGREKG